MNFLIAPNAFKNSLSAFEAAKALMEGLIQSQPKAQFDCCPVGDGGDGTGKLLAAYFNASCFSCRVLDPLGRPVEAGFNITPDGHTAIIELAEASGLKLLEPREYSPLLANTRGTGTLIKAALEKAVSKIVLCIGGSATVDGGVGLLKELGLAFMDKVGTEIEDIPLGLAELNNIDKTGFDERLTKTEIIILCDVKNKLLGKNGAARVFGPQKGANAPDILYLEKCLSRLDAVVKKTTGIKMSEQPYSGAAGGVAALLQAFCKANLVDGAKYFLQLIDFERKLENADIVITGEGQIDLQTLQGKAPFAIAELAKQKRKLVIGVAGKLPEKEDKKFKEYFDKLICINSPKTYLQKALKDTYQNLVNTGRLIGELY